MEFVGIIIDIAAFCAAFFLGVIFQPQVKQLLNRGKKRVSILAPVEPVPINPDLIGKPKPHGLYSDYTIEELERHKRFLDKDYRDNLNYPNTRWTIANKMKEALRMLEWHYANVAAEEFIEQRARNRRELDAFDELYGKALKDIQ